MDPKQEQPTALEASIKRLQQAIANGQTPAPLLQAVLAAAGAQALERVNLSLQKRREKERLREQKRLREKEAAQESAKPRGVVLAGAAVVILYFALSQPELWWLVFIALIFSLASARLLARAHRHSQRAALESNPGLAPLEVRQKRVDMASERLLADLKSGPQLVRDFVQQPEETIKALRTASQELTRRERELRSALGAEDERLLRRERAELEGRVNSEEDPVVRARLAAALSALDQQLAQRAELTTAAMRFEAEGTRILYTLESLRTQILRARSADASSAEVVGAGLRRSLEQIGEEMEAVAEALEAVNREDSMVVPVSPAAPVGEERRPGPSATRVH
jgi:hypothetical protein